MTARSNGNQSAQSARHPRGPCALAAFIISVDVTIVNVALPTLVRRVGASTTELQWVVDAYSLVFAALVLAAGSLSDRQGRKGTLLVGLAVFAAGSFAGAACPNRPPSSSRPVRSWASARHSCSLRRSRCWSTSSPSVGSAPRPSASGARPLGSASRPARSSEAGCSSVTGGAAIFVFMAVVAIAVAALVAWVPSPPRATRERSPIDWTGPRAFRAPGMGVAHPRGDRGA